MPDNRSARRAAEKAAREALSGTLVGAAGDLGVAAAAHRDAIEAATTARKRGQELVEEAKQAAAELARDADSVVEQAAADYGTSWDQARAAGWSPTQLREMGYAAPTGKRSKSTSPTAVTAPDEDGQNASADDPPVIPLQAAS